MERVRGALIAVARLAGGTPASVGETPKWTLIFQYMAETRRNLHQLVKGKQLYKALYGACAEVLHDLTPVIKDSATKRETAKPTSTETPPNEKFPERRRRKRKLSDDADKITKKPATSATEANDPPVAVEE
jgi:hypothetical protein